MRLSCWNNQKIPYPFHIKKCDNPINAGDLPNTITPKAIKQIGWYYYGARYYNPKASLWLSVDPLADYNPFYNEEHYIDCEHNGGVYNSGNNNPYIYCYQNPVVYYDPNGKQTAFHKQQTKPMFDYFRINASKSKSNRDVCITTHVIGMEKLLGKDLKNLGYTSKQRPYMMKLGYYGKTLEFNFNLKPGGNANNGTEDATTMKGSIGATIKNKYTGGTNVYAVELMNGYHSMTLTYRKDVTYNYSPLRYDITEFSFGKKAAEDYKNSTKTVKDVFTLHDQGTGYANGGNTTFNSAEELDSHLNSKIGGNNAKTAGGYNYPAIIKINPVEDGK